jgi:hypothetical protein
VFTPNSAPCDDGSACTTGDVCANGVCGGAEVACPVCERCDPGTGACQIGPRAPCVEGPDVRAVLRLRRTPTMTGNLLAWKWRRPSAASTAFGDPIASDDYALCVYDGTDALVVRGDAPAGCAAAGCWTAKPGGQLLYRAPSGSPGGLVKMQLKAKPGGGPKLSAKGRGATLAVPPPDGFALPIAAQLQSSAGVCFGATFDASGIRARDANQLKAKLP